MKGDKRRLAHVAKWGLRGDMIIHYKYIHGVNIRKGKELFLAKRQHWHKVNAYQVISDKIKRFLTIRGMEELSVVIVFQA